MSTSTIVPVAARTLRVALAGNPNAGKTTLFNALTGLRQKVANYPGVTVEKKTGRRPLPDGGSLEIIDLPGTYSLVANTPDEVVAADVLRGLRADTPRPDAIIAVVDAANLPRNLYLFSQLVELGIPLVVALNMVDVAERRGLAVDAAALARELGVPVVPVVGNRGRGIAELAAAVQRCAVPEVPTWPLPEALWEELHHLGEAIAASATARYPRTAATTPETIKALPQVIAGRRLLTDEPDPALQPLATLPAVAAALARARGRLAGLAIDPLQADIEARYRWIDGVVARCVTTGAPNRTISERVDGVLLHPVAGMAIFAAIMASLFITIFWIADPLMGFMQDAVVRLGSLVTGHLAEGPLRDLLDQGVFAGVAGVVVFVPQIAILFLFLGLLEDSGYLARAAFLMDRVLAKVGLHGKSFIPLLSSFACAIPGIMAARTIESKRDRLATILVAPFMSCSARLPVYGLLIGTFFAANGPVVQGLVLLGCYVLGILAAVAVALVFKLGSRREPPAPFILELPTYKLPQPSLVGWQAWNGTKAFLTKAGTVIFALSILLWALAYYPRAPQAALDAAAKRGEAAALAEAPPADEDTEALAKRVGAARDSAIQQAALEHSVAGRLGHAIEPAIAPLGFDWKMGVGLIGAFAAREVFNSYLGIIYSVGDPGEETAPLSEAIRADTRPDGRPVWTPLVAVSLLAWFVLAMQCISTTAVVRRETGGWTWPLIQLVLFNLIAYAVSLAIYQVGTALGY